MTNPRTLYQDFGSEGGLHQPAPAATSNADEDEMLEAFENGYQAGWDDSTKAQSGLELSVSSALAANLQDASFQYHELRNQLTKTVREITEGVINAVLPDMARLSLGAHIVQILEMQTRKAMDQQIELRVPEASVDAVERLLPETPIDFELIADPHLAPDQATLKLGKSEHFVDLGQAVKDVNAAVADYFETLNSEENND